MTRVMCAWSANPRSAASRVEAGLSLCEPFERKTDAQTVPVPRDRLTGLRLEDTAQVVRGYGDAPAELDHAGPRILPECLASAGDCAAARDRGAGAASVRLLRLDRFQELGEERHDELVQLVLPLHPPGEAAEEPVPEIEGCRGRDRAIRKLRLAAAHGRQEIGRHVERVHESPPAGCAICCSSRGRSK